MAARPRRTERGKAFHLACWKEDGVRGRKLEMERFINQHGVEICLSSEVFLNPGQAFRLVNYVCHHKDRLTAGAGQPSWSTVVQSTTQWPFPAWPAWRLLQFKSCWPTNRWKSLRLTFRLPAYWPEWTWSPVSAEGCRFYWPATWTLKKTLEPTAEHVTGETLTWMCRRELLFDLWTGHPDHQ